VVGYLFLNPSVSENRGGALNSQNMHAWTGVTVTFTSWTFYKYQSQICDLLRWATCISPIVNPTAENNHSTYPCRCGIKCRG